MHVLSRYRVPWNLITWRSIFALANSYLTWKTLKTPPGLAALIVLLAIGNFLKNFIKNIFFHPCSHLPGPFFLSGSYIGIGLGVLSGKSHYPLDAVVKIYGKVFRIAPDVVVIADKDMIHEILITKDFPKAPLYERLESPEFQQHNLFTSTNKQFHKARRRLVAPAFGLAYLRTLEPIMHDCIRKMIEKIDEILADPKSVRGKVLPRGQINIFQLMNRVALDIIGETAYGESFKMIEDDTNPLPHQMAKTLRRSMQQVYNPWMKYIFKQEWGLIEFGRACVRRRREAGEKGRRADLLQYLLDAQAREIAEGNGPTGDAHEDMITGKLTDNAVDMEAVIFIIAGSETSSTAITNTLMFLVNNPDKLKRLREELDLVTANNEPGTIPLHDQIRHCAYLTACINESMRIRPVAATGLPKEVDHDCTIGGYFFPKGTTVIVQIPQLHWNPEYFPEPNKYIPERWINEESPFPPVQDFTFYPFSAGTRNCVGKNFAMMEMRLILAILVLQFDLERVRWQRTDYVQYITTTFATESYIIKMKRRQLATSV